MRQGREVVLFCWLGLILAAAPGLVAQSGQQSPQAAGQSTANPGQTADLTQIVSSMEKAQLRNKESFRPYTVTREYKLFDSETGPQDPGQKPTSEVIASVNFVPPNHKSFSIDRAEGSDRGKTIVQHILENEAGMSGKGPTPLTTDNYEFTLLGEEWLNGRWCWILGLEPHKNDKTTIHGKAWVDKQNYLVQQVQGDIAKTPSWWLKRVQTTVHYGEAEGMWLPISTYSVADVRFFGKHVLTSRAVDVKASDEAANARSPRVRERRPGLPPLAGAGIYARP